MPLSNANTSIYSRKLSYEYVLIMIQSPLPEYKLFRTTNMLNKFLSNDMLEHDCEVKLSSNLSSFAHLREFKKRVIGWLHDILNKLPTQ